MSRYRIQLAFAVLAAALGTVWGAWSLAQTFSHGNMPRVVPASGLKGKLHLLPATMDTTQWGWFDNSQPPVLVVDSGDTIVVEHMMHSHNQLYPGRTIEELKKLRTDWPGRGPMTLTGPIFVNGADPGDTLKIRINKIVPRSYGANFNIPGLFGQFPKEFPDGQLKWFYLDWETRTAEFAPGLVLPLRPFPGTLGVARAEPGRYNAVPPGPFAGNLDNRDLVEGTTLYVPVFVKGALVWSGDAHAAQGNGEVNLTGLETAFKEFNITIEVVKGRRMEWPLIETPTDWITMGFDEDLNKALDNAKRETAKFLAEQRKIGAEAAAALMPKVSDCRVTQVVDIKKGVHCMNPKNTTATLTEERPTADNQRYHVSYMKDRDLNKAMDGASWNMLQLLQKERGLSRLDAYALASMAMDCRVGEMVAEEKSVHCLVAKSLWVAKK